MRRIVEKTWFFSRFFVPERLLRLYEKRKWSRQVDAIPRPDMSSKYRVLVTPARHAGQGKLWSDALDVVDGVSSRSLTVQDVGFGHDAEYTVSWTYATLSRRWQKELRQTLIAHYTHILVEASMLPLGGSFGGNFRKQISWLQKQGIGVGFIAHGSEVRLPSRHRKAEKWSPFVDPESESLTDELETLAAKNAVLYQEFDLPSFVSTAGLLADLPQAAFLGLVVDGQKYATTERPFARKKLIVCHISSHSILKATMRLEPILRRLEAEGLIEFRNYSGIPQDQVPEILASSDVVLDQFALGDYGVFACEGLASGRLVLSHVSETVRREIAQASGLELPIPETTLDNLEWRLRDIAADPDRYGEIAASGPGFVKQLHDGTYSARVLVRDFLAIA